MKPAFKATGALISIGGAVLNIIGLNPQRLSFSSEARFPGHPTPSGMSYQKTGLGPQTLTIEAKTFPHVMGGLDAYALLKVHHELQSVVPFLRLRGNYLGQASGLVGIETLETDEERLHPFDGVGREVDVTVGLILFPFRSLQTMDLTRLRGFGGLR
jgi:phage protein U